MYPSCSVVQRGRQMSVSVQYETRQIHQALFSEWHVRDDKGEKQSRPLKNAMRWCIDSVGSMRIVSHLIWCEVNGRAGVGRSPLNIVKSRESRRRVGRREWNVCQYSHGANH